jgi:hypothetical protein
MVKIQSKKKDTEKVNPNQPRVDRQIMDNGQYEIPNEGYRFKVYVYLAEIDGRWVVVEDEFKGKKGVREHWCEFRMWTFKEELALKKKATVYDDLKRIHYLDTDALNQLKIQKLLVDWSFSEDNPNLEIKRQNNALLDESYDAFTKLFPSIIRSITNKMNDVLEYNR